MHKIAALQMNSQADVTANLAAAEALLKKASENKMELVVLPEMFAIMSIDQHAKVAIAEPFGDGLIQNFLKACAKKYNLWIIGGTIPLITADQKRSRAACLVIDNHGMVKARYDKIHLFDIDLKQENHIYRESSSTEPGEKICAVDTPFGKIGLAVCYDLRFPELFRALCDQGTEIIIIPSAFLATTGEVHWEPLLRARAIENFCYVVASNQYGLHNNKRQTLGRSMIINPWGNIVAELPSGDGVVSAEIDLVYLHQIRKSIPMHLHRRIC